MQSERKKEKDEVRPQKKTGHRVIQRRRINITINSEKKSAREKCKEEQATDRNVFRNRTRYEADRAATNVEAPSLNMKIKKMKRDYNTILKMCRERESKSTKNQQAAE
jgi:hypothetical protein